MSKRQKATPPVEQPAAPPSEYEQGFIDCLALLREEVQRLSEANRTAIHLMWDSSQEVQSLLNFANPAINIVGDVQNRVEKRAFQRLNERHHAAKVKP